MLSKIWRPLCQRRSRGGWRQRAAMDSNCDVPSPRKSVLGKNLLLDWCDGELSTPKLVSYADAALRDGLSHPILERFSALAASDSSKYAQRNLCNILLNNCDVEELITDVGSGTHAILPSAYFIGLHLK